MTAQERPRRAALCLRSGAVAERSYPASDVRGAGRECQAATAQEQLERSSPLPRSGAVAGRSYPMPEARGSGQEDLPQVQGAVAVQAQEGREELLHIQVKEEQQ